MAEAKGQVTQFPSQSVTDSEKSSEKYGLEVARGIHNEWFTSWIKQLDTNADHPASGQTKRARTN